jgi:hypothetical protein
MQLRAESYAWVGWQSAIAMLGLSDLNLLVKRTFDRGFIAKHVLGFDHFEQNSNRESSTLGNRFGPMMTSTRSSVTPSTSYPDGIVSPSNTAKTESAGGNRPRQICFSASPTRIHSEGSGETTHVLAAAGRSSRSAVSVPHIRAIEFSGPAQRG